MKTVADKSENLLRVGLLEYAGCGMDETQMAIREFGIERYTNGASGSVIDYVVAEEPLEVRLDGHPVAVLMRTPGFDTDLVTGFLVTEGILKSPAQVRKVEADGNRILVFLNDGERVDLGKFTRNMYAGSSCGICGKATLDAIFLEFPKLETKRMPSSEILLSAPAELRSRQENFSATGGLHAAGLFGFDGELLALREDIGRHNAVDKVIGHAIGEGIPTSDCWLLVSGRVSFEIMQKALAVGIPCVAAISAPSSLAVDFAKGSGQALVGFLRVPGFNRYA